MSLEMQKVNFLSLQYIVHIIAVIPFPSNRIGDDTASKRWGMDDLDFCGPFETEKYMVFFVVCMCVYGIQRLCNLNELLCTLV